MRRAVEKLMLAAVLQKLQTLTYYKIRFGLELFSRLAIMAFERPVEKGEVVQQKVRLTPRHASRLVLLSSGSPSGGWENVYLLRKMNRRV